MIIIAVVSCGAIFSYRHGPEARASKLFCNYEVRWRERHARAHINYNKSISRIVLSLLQ